MVLISSDREGMFGHQCPQCGGYWRAESGSICPYCRAEFRTLDLLTPAQRKYVREFCHRVDDIFETSEDGDYVVDMDAVADAVGDENKPAFYYSEEAQQNNFKCTACERNTDILGRYGYCSSCGTRNGLAQVRHELNLIRERIKAGGPFEPCAKDAVSAFDSLAKNYALELAQLIPITPRRRGRLESMGFHALVPAAEFLQEVFDIDLFDGFGDEDRAFIVRMFHRRHVYEHLGGEADEKYIQDSGDIDVRPRQALRETVESAHRTVSLVSELAKNLHHGFHELIQAKAV